MTWKEILVVTCIVDIHDILQDARLVVTDIVQGLRMNDQVIALVQFRHLHVDIVHVQGPQLPLPNATHQKKFIITLRIQISLQIPMNKIYFFQKWLNQVPGPFEPGN